MVVFVLIKQLLMLHDLQNQGVLDQYLLNFKYLGLRFHLGVTLE
jgi:hypothetical protein